MKRMVALAVAAALTLSLSACSDKNDKAYKSAVKLYNAEKYSEAKAAFQQLGDYEDSKVRIQKCDYEMATDLFLKGDYLSAEAALEAMNGFKNSTELAQTCSYLLAQQAIHEGNFQEAVKRLEALGSYMDSQAILDDLKQMEYAEQLHGTWVGSLGDVTKLVTDALAKANVEINEGFEEESEESEDESTEEEATEDNSGVTKLDMAEIVKLDPVEATLKLELLPSGAFVMDLDGGADDVVSGIRQRTRQQIRKYLESYVEAYLEGGQTIQAFLGDNDCSSLEEYALYVLGLDVDDLLENNVDKVLQKVLGTLPTYGAYRLENGAVILAVGANESSCTIGDGAAKLTLNSDTLGTVELSKN